MTATRVTVIGNPNSGKTSLFNALTGTRQWVGHWPGVTLEQKTGLFSHGAEGIEVTDLPGIYSVSAAEGSTDERIARDHVLSQRAGVLINVVDAANLERNLFLTMQLLDLGRPMILALNMMDIAKRSEIRIDIDGLSAALGCPVVPVVATRGQGLTRLKDRILQVSRDPSPPKVPAHGAEIDALIADLVTVIEDRPVGPDPVDPSTVADDRRSAVRLIAGDFSVREALAPELRGVVDTVLQAFEDRMGEAPDLVLADQRFKVITDITAAVVGHGPRLSGRAWDRIIRVVLHPWLGMPILLFSMFLMFLVLVWASNIGGAFLDLFDPFPDRIPVEGGARNPVVPRQP